MLILIFLLIILMPFISAIGEEYPGESLCALFGFLALIYPNIFTAFIFLTMLAYYILTYIYKGICAMILEFKEENSKA